MIVYVVVGQTQLGNFVMNVFSSRHGAENFIDSLNGVGYDHSPYIEEHILGD